MKASFFSKLVIITKTVSSTLGISIIALYKQMLKTLTRPYADAVLRWWAGYLLKAVNASYTVYNDHKVTIEPGTAYIIMSNHRSHYDIPLIFSALPGSIRMLTKKELFKVPIWGRGLKTAEFLSIDRQNTEQAIRDLEFAKEKMKTGVVLWVAPEGTRTRTGRLGEFKKGGFVLAIQMGASIIPVGIRGSEKILKPKTWDFFLGQEVEVHIGKPIDASAYTLEQRSELMADVRSEILRLSGEN
ncbi:MAG: lysophospholipid acyltransferase family protein [Desulfomonilia bacterium]|nr:lysophospholipid acyltransferase family protein [Desulfomonilia bacterium]